MRKIGKVKYNGTSTADLGVIVSGEAAFDAAAPDYTSYQIPGKNGDLMLSNNRYLNIDVTYPAFIPADFEDKVQAIRNWMRSARSYARIEDNYDLLHYRMGMGKDVLTFEPSAENVGSNMSLVFDCKPQRYLYSGEEEKQIGVWGPVQAASGDVVTFEDDENGAFKSISASITPTQDLHGYEYPWPPGGGPEGAPNANICPITGWTGATAYVAGKNLLRNTKATTVVNGVTFTVNSDGSVTANGTNTSDTQAELRIPMPKISGNFYFCGCPSGGSSTTYDVYPYNVTAGSRYKKWNGTNNANSDFGPYTLQEVQIPQGNHTGYLCLRVSKNATVNNIVFRPMIVMSNVTDNSWAPYAGSFTPVSWQTEAGEVYSGTVDFVSGVLTVDRATITFNGSETWYLSGSGTSCNYRALRDIIVHPPNNQTVANILSDSFESKTDDETSQGQIGISVYTGGYIRICHTGKTTTVDEFKAWLSQNNVQVVYELATPQTYQLSGQDIKTLLGLNNVWADSGTVTAEWGEDPFGLYNPTLFDALPLIKVKNPQNGCAVTVNGTTMTCSRRYTGTVIIDCELMNVYSGATNLNADWSKDFPVLSPGENSVTFSGADAVTIIPRWWEL